MDLTISSASQRQRRHRPPGVDRVHADARLHPNGSTRTPTSAATLQWSCWMPSGRRATPGRGLERPHGMSTRPTWPTSPDTRRWRRARPGTTRARTVSLSIPRSRHGARSRLGGPSCRRSAARPVGRHAQAGAPQRRARDVGPQPVRRGRPPCPAAPPDASAAPLVTSSYYKTLVLTRRQPTPRQ